MLLHVGKLLPARAPHMQLTKSRFHQDDRAILLFKCDTGPPCLFADLPEVANVELTEVQAREQGYHAQSDSVLFRTLGKAQVIGEIAGLAKIVSDAKYGRILGVHLVGPHAFDLIAEGTLDMQLGGTVKKLAETIHAYPPSRRGLPGNLFQGLGRPLHG